MKKFFVKGGILINTPFFRHEGAGAGFADKIPEGSHILPTNDKLSTGEEYLLIDEKHPQSIFAEYYASSFFTAGYSWAPLFHKTYEDNYKEYCSRINDVRQLMKLSLAQEDNNMRNLLSRHEFLTIMTAFENFVADSILTRITNDENMFYTYARNIDDKYKIQDDIKACRYGHAEQKIIEFVLMQSYCNVERVKEVYNNLFGFKIKLDKHINDLFKARHRLAHRGGRKKDGKFVQYSQKDIEKVISSVDTLVRTICEKIYAWERA